MAGIVICGGSVIGLCAGMMLARDGHEVTVLEGDPDGAPVTPDEAWAAWRRRGVAQFRQPHNLFARFREVADRELPGLTDRLLAAGCVWVDFLDPLPPSIADRAPRPGDERLRFITGRRPVVESVVATAAAEQPGLTVRRGVRVAGLVAGPSAVAGVPHVTGVRTTTGDELPADLVVDATGRRTPAADWLTGIGARPPEVEAEDRGFVYYTRYFTGPRRPPRMGPTLMPAGSISVLTLDGDNDTWSVTLFGLSGDAPLKQLRSPDAFTRVVSALPLQAHWLDGAPLDGVLAMAGILDCHRSLVVDGDPIVTGYLAVGDAWACTNPSAGRGLSVGLVQAQLLRTVVAAHLGDPATLATAFDEGIRAGVEYLYRSQVANDRFRVAEMRACAEGTPPPQADPVWSTVQAVGMQDADVFRAMVEVINCLAPARDVLGRPEIAEKLAGPPPAPPPPPPGPDRNRLLQLLAD
ncbi:2-polyprenyl-6-methoxyphenol hydroxylase [Trujillonella endophytica]|uniref:2-polyprenyl-6-methoxyphenol hydroxylase n=1 Tax=Trujillonella endophytica TaxID=673521 RepID=A0A1H8VJH3_9ACTN|nr:2-polyprenyl-6-methoxyphenol hydroxylase [Trujillella endophytica]